MVKLNRPQALNVHKLLTIRYLTAGRTDALSFGAKKGMQLANSIEMSANDFRSKQVGFHLAFGVDVKRQIGNPKMLS